MFTVLQKQTKKQHRYFSTTKNPKMIQTHYVYELHRYNDDIQRSVRVVKSLTITRFKIYETSIKHWGAGLNTKPKLMIVLLSIVYNHPIFINSIAFRASVICYDNNLNIILSNWRIKLAS